MNDSILNPSGDDKRLIKRRHSSRLNYDDVDIMAMFAEEGCQVTGITREIVESGTRRRVYKVIDYVAACGHPVSIRLQKFLRGQGRVCPSCARPRGERHHSYNPNLTDEERIAHRDTRSNVVWREAVYKRDQYTCQVCGDSRGGNLIAHHLNSYTDYPEQRYDIENGVTLCADCHMRFHHLFSYYHNTRDQFEDWLRQDNTEITSEDKDSLAS